MMTCDFFLINIVLLRNLSNINLVSKGLNCYSIFQCFFHLGGQDIWGL